MHLYLASVPEKLINIDLEMFPFPHLYFEYVLAWNIRDNVQFTFKLLHLLADTAVLIQILRSCSNLRSKF